MKILIVRLYPYELKIDGYNVQEIGLAKALTNKGHQCDIVLYTSSNERVQEIKTDGGLIKIFWIKGINFLKNGMYGNKIINLAKQYDIIQSSEYDQLYNLKLNRKLKSKLIIYHGPYYSKFNKRYNLKCRIFDTLFLTKKYKNTKFITKSELATEFLKEKGIKNVKTIGVGLNDEMIKKENKNKILNELNENIKYLLYIGKLEERRNIIFLLNILKKIIAKKENVKLVIVGKGDKQYIDKIFEYIEKNDNTILVLSGGQGSGEDVSEAQAMYDYLVQKGVDKSRLLLEDKSTSTVENIEYSMKIIEKNSQNATAKVGFITNNFHVFRAELVCRNMGYDIKGIPAKSDNKLLVNYMFREFFALVKYKITGNI